MEKTIKEEVKNVCGDCDYVIAKEMGTAYYLHWKDCHKHSIPSALKFGLKMLIHNMKTDEMDKESVLMIFDSFWVKSTDYIYDHRTCKKIEKKKRKMEKDIKKKHPEYYTKWIIESGKRQQKN